MKGIYACFFLVFVGGASFGQIGNFRSITSGNWDNPSTWQRDVDGNGVYTDLIDENPSTVYPSSTSGTITFQADHEVTIPTGVTISADEITLVADPQTKLVVNGSLDLNNGTGSEITLTTNRGTTGIIEVYGTIIFNEGTTTSNFAVGRLLVKNGGIYQHNYQVTAGIIYDGTWEAGSTLAVTGYTTYEGDGPLGLSQSFYDVTWNCPGHSAFFINLNGTLTSIINDFTIVDTGGAVLSLSDAVAYTMNIGGDFITQANASVYFNYESTAAANVTVGGNFDWSSTVNSGISDGGNTTLTVNGDLFVRSGATLRLNNGDFATGNVDVTLLGDLNVAASSTLTKSSNGSAGATSLIFNGANPQLFINSGTVSGKVNVTVKNGAVVDFGTYALTGTGNYTLEAGGTMKVGSADGLVTGINMGNIRVSGLRTYNAAANIVYNGTVNQNLGNEWSSTGALSGVSVNLDINSALVSGVVKNDNIGVTSVLGTFTLTQGILEIGNSNTLEIRGALTISGGTLRGSSTSSLTISGSGSVTGALTFETGILNNFTIGRAVDIALGSDLTIVGAIDLSFGNLDISGQTLTMNGSGISSASTGLKSTDVNSNLIIGGSTFTGDIPFIGTSNVLNNLTFATTGTSTSYTWNSVVTILNSLSLNAGTVTHTSGLTMSENSTVTMSGGTFSASPSSSPLNAETFYHLVYQGTQNTGVELPTSGANLMNLTVSSGTVSLSSNATVNGNVTLAGGILSAGMYSITLAGTSKSWIKQSGSFSPGTGTVIISGSVSVEGSNPQFGNLTAQAGSSLTQSSANISLTGNLQLSSTATFNHSSGTVTLNGSGAQTISAAGKVLNNLTVNKSGGDVTLGTALNLTGLLNIQTATTVASGGNLTLLSNASGTAMVGSLLGGGSVTGDVNAQRYFAKVAEKYRDISAPVLNPPVSDITGSGIYVTGDFTGSSYPCTGCDTNNPSFYYYDESVAGVQTLGYVAYPPSGGNSSTSLLSPGRGYNLYLRTELGSPTMTLSGPINSGTIPLPVTYTTSSGGINEDGWNFVGNPFPSPVDWDVIGGWSKNNISGNQIAIYDPAKGSSGGYRVWNGSVGDLGSGLIASGQGFWVKASGTPTLTVNEGAKSTSSASFYRKKVDASALEVILVGNESEDRTYIFQKEGGALNLDSNDGPKLMVQKGLNLAVLTTDNAKVAIQAIGQDILEATLPLYLSGVTPGTYTFSRNLSGVFEDMPIWLFDSFTNVHHDFTDDYSFTVTESNEALSKERFYIVIGRSSIVTGVEEPLSSILTIYPNPVVNSLFAKVKCSERPGGEILDRMGKVIGEILWNQEESQIWKGSFEMHAQSSGIYFARLNLKGSLRVVKFVKY